MRNEYLPTYQSIHLSLCACVGAEVYRQRSCARERERGRERARQRENRERESGEVILVAEVFQKMVSGAQKRFPTVVGR